MPRIHCEFCGLPPRWRFFNGPDYVRLSCADHIARVRRLIKLDFGPKLGTYQFEPFEAKAKGGADGK